MAQKVGSSRATVYITSWSNTVSLWGTIPAIGVVNGGGTLREQRLRVQNVPSRQIS